MEVVTILVVREMRGIKMSASVTLLPHAYIVILLLLMMNCRLFSCCTSPVNDCPVNCQCSQLSTSFLVDCSSKGMDSLPTKVPNCTSLYINISKNKLKKLEYRDYMTNVIHIDASYNKISEISETFLHLLTSSMLETLFVDHNELTTLSAAEVAFMKHLRLVSIHDNQWNCDCELRDVYSWLTSAVGNAANKVHNVNGTVCFLPEFYTRRPIVSLDDEDICKIRNRKLTIWFPIVITISCVVYLIVMSIVATCIVIRRRQKIIDVGTQ